MKVLLQNPDILAAILALLTVVVTTLGGLASRYLMRKTDNEEIAATTGRFFVELTAAMKEVGQTFLDAIRKERPATDAELEEAKRRALDKAKENFGPAGVERLKRILGTTSLESWAATHLEALVRDAKPKPVLPLTGLSIIAVLVLSLGLSTGCSPAQNVKLVDGIEAGVKASRGAADRAAARILKWNAVAEAAIEAAATNETELAANLAKLDQVRQPVEAAFAAVDAALAAVEPLLPLMRKGKVDPLVGIAAAVEVYQAADRLRAALQALGVR